MSRGPGTIQQAVLAALARSEADISLNQLCWDIGAPNGTELRAGFYKSFYRAINRLEDSGKVAVFRRGLTDLDEVVRIYPSKATTLVIKRLRERLLPIVKSYLEQTGHRKFGAEKNELHLLSKKPPTRATLAKWYELELRLLHEGGHVNSEPDRRSLIAVLSKGRSLFVEQSPRVSGSFGRAIEEFFSTPLASGNPELAADLGQFYSSCIDITEHRKVLLKDRLYAIVDFTSNRASSLNETFKEELLKREPEYIRKLPGHADARKKNWYRYGETQYSAVLDSLLRRDVLSKFAFLRRC